MSSQTFADRLESYAAREQAKQKRVPRTSPKMPTHKVIYLIELNDIQRAWHVSAHRIYQLVEQERIHVYAQPGRRKRYSVDDMLRELGEPRTVDVLGAAIAAAIESKLEAEPRPRYRSRFEREAEAA